MMCISEVQKYRAELTRSLGLLEIQIVETKAKLFAISVILEGEQ